MKKLNAKILTFSALLVASASSFAALPVGISAEMDAIQADGDALVVLVWPVVIALFGSLLMFKLFKRFGSKI
jgi:putative Mn2+ efflux pump MntP